MAASFYTDAVLLLGDSITQAWSEGSFAQRLSEYYLRRLDILNRGYGGYNSEWGVPVLEQVFAKKKDREAGHAQDVKLMMIWWGANDAVLPGLPQYCPLEQFKSNLATMINMIRDPTSEWYSPETRLVLITPPPFVPEDRAAAQIEKWKLFGSKGEPPTLDRDPERTKSYVDAVLEVGTEFGIPTVNMWQAIVDDAGGLESTKLRPYFLDGLHPTSLGYRVLMDHLTALVVSTWPEMHPDAIEMRMPHWGDIDFKHPRRTIGPRKDKPKPGGPKDEL